MSEQLPTDKDLSLDPRAMRKQTKRKQLCGWGDGSMGKVLAVQVSKLSCDP